MRKIVTFSLATVFGLFLATTSSWADEPIHLATWDRLLQEYVHDGLVGYERWVANAEDLTALEGIVTSIAAAELGGSSDLEKLAFYINAYNVLVVHQVLELWAHDDDADGHPDGVSNVLEEDGFFDGVRFVVAGRELTLNALEHEVIRVEFQEPRIHFAVNCASLGCPVLRSEAFRASRLNEQLVEATTVHLRENVRIDRSQGSFAVSRIFDWFSADFVARGIREFIASHLEGPDALFVRDPAHTMDFVDWDWAINAR